MARNDIDEDYIKALNLNKNHTYKQIDTVWKQKKGEDFDLYTYEEYNETQELVRTFTVRDSTHMYPPFTRRISYE